MNRQKTNTAVFICTILIVFSVAIVSLIKYRNDNVNYLNSDATWHTLLTMESYDETPIRQHKFLPIVSLGNIDDKFISWGETIPDEKGNYYYTSFSPAGYILPFLFVKLFHLPINELSLYIFNTFLFIISSLLWFALLNKIYSKSKNKYIVILIGVLCYIFSPELFHGMGIVYWHQSVMQVTLLIQLLSYYIWKNEDSKKAKVIFFAMTLINPYIEWTGYVANIGFALAELLTSLRQNRKWGGWNNVLMIGMFTTLSFILFSLHYLSVVSFVDFFTALKNRFFTRSFASAVSITDLFKGYIESFLFLWVLLFVLIVWNLIRNKKVLFRHKLLMFVMIFPVLENIIMKEHAITYTYDRMKAIFILSFVICELTDQLLSGYLHRKRFLSTAILCIAFFSCFAGNFIHYKNNEDYIWRADYRQDNEKLAEYINKNYFDSILVVNYPVRGYINLLFERGIYEQKKIDSAISLANQKGKKYAIEVEVNGETDWNMYQLSGATIYNTVSGETQHITLSPALNSEDGIRLE